MMVIKIIIKQKSNFSIRSNSIIYVPSQQLQGQLQTQHSVDTGNYINEIIIIIISSKIRSYHEEKS
jgi:hypothetical protein